MVAPPVSAAGDGGWGGGVNLTEALVPLLNLLVVELRVQT